MLCTHLDPELVCRDENCEIEAIHQKHLVIKRTAKAHHRPTRTLQDLLDDPNSAIDDIVGVQPMTGRAIIEQRKRTRERQLATRDRAPGSWEAIDPRGLTHAVQRAVPDYPVTFKEILRDVRDDYGTSLSLERTVHRALVRLTKSGAIRTIPVALPFAFRAYVKPTSRLQTLPDAREYLLGTHDGLRTWNGGDRYAF